MARAQRAPDTGCHHQESPRLPVPDPFPASTRNGAPVDFAFSEEQEEFRATLRRFFDDVSPFSEVQRLIIARHVLGGT